MRLKLVLIASLIAAAVGSGAAIAIVLFFSASESMTAPGLLVASSYLLPAVTIFVASMFVYRHTARRRKVQAALTVLVSLVLTIAIFVATSMITSRLPGRQQAAPPRNVG
ncbi:MAG TPA: hypothetical protein VJU86_05110 [Pyrinomonadaceae bacterium]|nr:hypothetical protein [Pyrinomonadaceae bacterium]